MSIPFTQYMMPDGAPRPVTIDRPPEVEALAEGLLAAGAKFEIEMLWDYSSISMTVETEDEDGEVEVLASRICRNGPDVPEAVDSMIKEAAKTLSPEAGS